MDAISRIDYDCAELSDGALGEAPLAPFLAWLHGAERAGVAEPNAMALATAGADGRPRARTVLLKAATADGFAFFTNYESIKGRQLAENPWASAVFHWQPLHRQVIVEGPVERVPAAESDAYFGSRPRAAQIGAWASRQSQRLQGREELEQWVADAEARFPDPVPRPPHWGGYLIRAEVVEFWQGRPSRLHDRIRFDRRGPGGLDEAAAWEVSRLSP